MKKLIVLLLSIFVAMNIFAAAGEALEGVSEATLNLTLANQYKFAFIAASDVSNIGGQAPVTPLSEFTLHTTGDAFIMNGGKTTLRLDEARNVFYFYYQAYTNVDNLKIKISAPNSLSIAEDTSAKPISYTASFQTVEGKWDGGGLSSRSITSGSDTSFAKANIKKNSTTEGDDFNYMGLCKVVISSTEDLGKKKPGIYSANIKLTLTAN